MRKFFRIELDKTGAILTCTEVEASEKGGRFVRYVEALDKAEAVETVKAWWLARKAAHAAYEMQRRAAQRAACICLDCKEPLDGDSAARCIACNKRRAVEQAQRRAGTFERSRLPNASTAVEAKQRARAVVARHDKKRTLLIGNSYERTLKRALAHFDKLGPKQYRAWLVGRIAQLEAKRLAKQKLAA